MENICETICDLSDLIKVVNEINSEYKGQVWWRGQSKFTWKLQFSVEREDRGALYERNIVYRFMQRTPSRCSNFPKDDDHYGWLYLMQHYGLPTRLLDWTESPLIATYFAVEDDNYFDIDGAIFALNPYQLNKNQIEKYNLLLSNTHEAKEIVKPAFIQNFPEYNHVLSIVPCESHLRMMVQLSMFTIHGNKLIIDEIENNDKFLRKYRIPSSAKKEIVQQLKFLGIRRSNLFPDLDHLAKEIKGLSFKTYGDDRTDEIKIEDYTDDSFYPAST